MAKATKSDSAVKREKSKGSLACQLQENDQNAPEVAIIVGALGRAERNGDTRSLGWLRLLSVRSSPIKRVASAVGEGAMAVQFVREYLREM